MQSRRLLLLCAIAAVTACGLSAVGGLLGPEGPGGEDGGRPGFLPDGAPIGDASGIDDGGAGDADSSFIDQQKCLAVCDGGTCDAGTCVIDCTGLASCLNTAIVCPPGVPCDVACGAGKCTAGVDCTKATACNIDCSALGACTNAGVVCAGSRCNVVCGDGACDHAVSCDAGSCNIQCTGATSCKNAQVECTSATSCFVKCAGAGSCDHAVACNSPTCGIACTGQSSCNNAQVTCTGNNCSIQCGDDAGGGSGKTSCDHAASCTATTACYVGCIANDNCTNAQVVAKAQNVYVACIEDNTCNFGVAVTAGDAAVDCRKPGSCGTVQCDGGRCVGSCLDDKSTGQFCCSSTTPTCVRNPNGACDLSCP